MVDYSIKTKEDNQDNERMVNWEKEDPAMKMISILIDNDEDESEHRSDDDSSDKNPKPQYVKALIKNNEIEVPMIDTYRPESPVSDSPLSAGLDHNGYRMSNKPPGIRIDG